MPADFYMLEMNNEYAKTSPIILLGRPFQKITKAIVNVDNDLLNIEFDSDVVSFNIFDDMKSPYDQTFLYALDTHDKFEELINPATIEHFDNVNKEDRPSEMHLSIVLDFVATVNR